MSAGKIIKKLRKERGLTQEAFSKLLGISKASVQKYEQGDVLNLKAEMLRKLCLFLNVSPIVFIFPEHIDVEKDDISNFYDLNISINLITNYRTLSKKNKLKVNEYVNDLNAAQNYLSEKE